MALHTFVSLPDAQALGGLYGLALATVEGLKAGCVNSNYRLQATDGTRFFLRVYEEQDATGAAEEGRLLTWLADRGVPTTRPLPRQDGQGSLASFAGKPVAVFPWIDGQMRCQASVQPRDTYAVGQALARVHFAGAPTKRPGRFQVTDLLTRCERITREGPVTLRPLGRQLEGALRQVAAQRAETLPTGLCHGDLFRDNVLWRGTDLTALLDFESAADAPFVFDIAVTMLAWCFGDDFRPELISSLLAGYTAVRSLTDEERAGFYVESRVAALRFTVTRVTDYAMRAHLGVTEERHWQRFFQRYERLGELGPSGVAALLPR